MDVAIESYFTGGGLFSIGGFHRAVKDMARNVTRLETVPWATVPRQVTTPSYLTRQTAAQSLDQSPARVLDALAGWNFSRSVRLRVAANNLAPLDNETRTTFTSGDSTRILRLVRTIYGANLEFKL